MVERMAIKDTEAEAQQAFRAFGKDENGCIPFSELRQTFSFIHFK
jgi:Ca2+-binding EF-hand superfamily protein